MTSMLLCAIGAGFLMGLAAALYSSRAWRWVLS